MIKKEYLYRTGANERVELTPDTLYWLTVTDGERQATLIDNPTSVFQKEESSVMNL